MKIHTSNKDQTTKIAINTSINKKKNNSNIQTGKRQKSFNIL